MTNDWKLELVNARLHQANESLADACLLLEKGGSIRSAINRIYYSLFYSATALLLNKDFSSQKHSGVIALFDVNFVRTGLLPIWMSQLFHELFDLRMEADYKISHVVERETVAGFIPKTRDFLLRVEEFLSGSAG